MSGPRVDAEHVPSRIGPSSLNKRAHRIMSCVQRPGASLSYVAAAIFVLGLVAYAALNIAYLGFAAAMSVVNAFSGEPVVYLHGRILREAEAGATIRYEVVRLPSASAYADQFSINLIVIEARNASRWPITGISPRCALAFADGDWAYLTPDTRAERTRLDDTGEVSTAVPPGGTLRASLRTAEVRHSNPVVRADCRFDIAVPWWVWASDMRRDQRS